MPESPDLAIFVMTVLIYVIGSIQIVIILLSLHVCSLGSSQRPYHDNIMVPNDNCEIPHNFVTTLCARNNVIYATLGLLL